VVLATAWAASSHQLIVVRFGGDQRQRERVTLA